MDFTSATLGYCFNPFEFCIEGERGADTTKAADIMAEQLADDYRVAIVHLGATRSQMRQQQDSPFLTVHLPADHHPLRRPMRLLDADVVIVSGVTGGKLPRVLLSPDSDNTISGAITCLHDPGKAASLKRAARSVSHWLEQRATQVPVYGLLVESESDKITAVYRAAGLLGSVCEKTFMYSSTGGHPDLPGIKERFSDHGLTGAILSAQMEHPGVAWMVMTTRQAGILPERMQYMREHRNPFRYVTAFNCERQPGEESMCGIWEPKSKRRLLEGLGCGVSNTEELLAGTPHSALNLPKA